MSSTEQRPDVQVQRDRKSGGFDYTKLIVPGVVVVLLLIFIFSNRVDWPFSFLFIHFNLVAWLMLVITLAIGFVLGFVVSALLRQRKKRELKRRAREM